MKARIIETVLCLKCNEYKPYPSDFIVSFNKGTVENACASCRKKRRSEAKAKRVGLPELAKGWRDKENNFRKRSNAIVERKRKEDERSD